MCGACILQLGQPHSLQQRMLLQVLRANGRLEQLSRRQKPSIRNKRAVEPGRADSHRLRVHWGALESHRATQRARAVRRSATHLTRLARDSPTFSFARMLNDVGDAAAGVSSAFWCAFTLRWRSSSAIASRRCCIAICRARRMEPRGTSFSPSNKRRSLPGVAATAS